uniref:ATP synthase complex subunit 8 n=1 Tax=Cucujoidea sp. 35 KM-2017 TaxID=2219373 RepID=A0A346RFX4_9CUCU|nr:ATP synthase F0 subunit 8 [Cucujoidea sp. 35 KM-2017]
MPQMAPMNWLVLFCLFTIIIMLINIMNYYFYMKNTSPNNVKQNKFLINWKW